MKKSKEEQSAKETNEDTYDQYNEVYDHNQYNQYYQNQPYNYQTQLYYPNQQYNEENYQQYYQQQQYYQNQQYYQQYYGQQPYYQTPNSKVEKVETIENPVEKPVEKPSEKPSEKPASGPVFSYSAEPVKSVDPNKLDLEQTKMNQLASDQVKAQMAKKRKIEIELESSKKVNTKSVLRKAGGEVWKDESLSEWKDDDFRIFCGDLGNEVTDKLLEEAFSHYPSLLKAKVVRDKRTTKTKGFGFVSFSDLKDYMKAMKEMNGKYVGNRPLKLRKSNWKDRQLQ